MLTPLDVLARFKSNQAWVFYEDAQEHLVTEGGGLADAVDGDGLAWISGLLHARPQVHALQFDDEGVALRVDRDGDAAVLRVRWANGSAYEQPLPVEPHPAIAAPTGPLLRPYPESRVQDPVASIQDPNAALFAVREGDALAWYTRGAHGDGVGAVPLVASLSPSPAPGSAAFCQRMGIQHAYVAGAMAGGIGSPEIVVAMSRAGMLGFFGAGGLPMSAVKDGVKRIKEHLHDGPAGFNLLHNPVEPAVEEATVDLYLEQGCDIVSTSAFMGLTPAVVRYRYTGIHRDASGQVVCPNRLLAKVSRAEVARHFIRPAPEKLLQELVRSGGLSAAEVELAAQTPMADGITAEADSGGHTDSRPLSVIVPLLRRQRDAVAKELGYAELGVQVFIGAAGGIGTPQAVHAALALGAEYVLTGSINQASLEAGTSDVVKAMLLQAGMADVAKGPAPDMFEIGAEVQVLSRGTMYARRARRLHETWKGHAEWDQVPRKDRQRIEKQILGRHFDEVWEDCVAYWGDRDAGQLQKAERDPRHKMALVFRWYLGMTSRWARMGESSRKRDYQVWCGASMGAFNDWVAGSSLEGQEARGVVEMAQALLRGAQVVGRAQSLAAQGVELPAGAGDWRP